jgi:hypothetical protein
MTMKRLIGTILLSALLGACAAPNIWTKPDVTAEEWRSDQYSCERDMRMSIASFGSIYTRDYYAKQFYARCLQSKGYSVVKQ